MIAQTRIKVYYTNPLGQLLHFDSTELAFNNLKAAEIYFTEFYGVECHCEYETNKEIVTC
jgi:hypothetical protein